MTHHAQLYGQVDIETLYNSLKNFKPRFRKDKLEIQFVEDLIIMNEVYYSGVNRTYRALGIYNKSTTTISKNNDFFQVSINIFRDYHYRKNPILTIVAIIALFGLIIYSLCFKNPTQPGFKITHLALIEFVLFASLLIRFYISQTKHKDIIKLIKDSMVSTQTKL